MREQYAYVEGLLADGREWAVADSYSVVEPYLWGGLTGLNMRSLYPTWTSLAERTVGRAPVRRAIEREGLPAAV